MNGKGAEVNWLTSTKILKFVLAGPPGQLSQLIIVADVTTHSEQATPLAVTFGADEIAPKFRPFILLQSNSI